MLLKTCFATFNILVGVPFADPLIIAWCRKADINPIALRKAKITYNFGLSECKG